MTSPLPRPDLGVAPDGDDMIASIRRLVSDRPAPAPEAIRPAPLRLTPDQRVSDPDPNPTEDAALRALVAEAVRAELQGAAGTRFTRQLRRLIRAEIAAALAARPR
ncbi:hypothetical protein [Rhodobaculum claviforme]|uniref:Uncharacterized protein n=1 Tax=Rhodobaculum claviforme TaxID=1549854 RepID=A0A934THL5_9RHOB|nr:hypothetical protein [Rhodobaculum claviforme]MBK5926095.1 hypothetical protein [Rhodobaculum claviforme]